MIAKSGDWESHPYRLEVTPWLQISHLERILLARGAYVAAVGVLETGITELAIRLSRHPEYHALRDYFPSRRNARLSFLKDACRIDGALGENANLVNCFVTRLENYSRLRDILAHGEQSALSEASASETLVNFKDYFASPGGAELRIEQVALLELEKQASKACRTSRVWSQFYPKLDGEIAKLEY